MNQERQPPKTGEDSTLASAPIGKKEIVPDAASKASCPVSQVHAESLNQIGSEGTAKENLTHYFVVASITRPF